MAVTFQLFQIPPTPKGEQGIFFEAVFVYKLYIVASHTSTAKQQASKKKQQTKVLLIVALKPEGFV